MSQHPPEDEVLLLPRSLLLQAVAPEMATTVSTVSTLGELLPFWITCPWTEKNEILTQCLLCLKNYLLSLVVWVVRLCFQACREESRLVWRKWNFSGSSRYLPLLSQSTNKQTKRESQFPDRKWLYRFPGEWSGTCTCPAESLTLRGLGFLFHTGYSQASFRSIFIVCVCFSLYPAGYSHFNKIGWFCCQTLGVCQVG